MVFHPFKEKIPNDFTDSTNLCLGSHQDLTVEVKPENSSRWGKNPRWQMPLAMENIQVLLRGTCWKNLETRFDIESLSYKWFTIHCLRLKWLTSARRTRRVAKKNSCRPCVDAGCPTGKKVWSMDNILSNTNNVPASFTYDISSFPPLYAVLNLHAQLVLQTKKLNFDRVGSSCWWPIKTLVLFQSLSNLDQHVCEVRHVQVQIPPIIWIPFIESTNWFLISENLKDNSPWTTTIFFNPGTDVPLPPAHGAVRIEMDHKTLRC